MLKCSTEDEANASQQRSKVVWSEARLATEGTLADQRQQGALSMSPTFCRACIFMSKVSASPRKICFKVACAFPRACRAQLRCPDCKL